MQMRPHAVTVTRLSTQGCSEAPSPAAVSARSPDGSVPLSASTDSCAAATLLPGGGWSSATAAPSNDAAAAAAAASGNVGASCGRYRNLG